MHSYNASTPVTTTAYVHIVTQAFGCLCHHKLPLFTSYSSASNRDAADTCFSLFLPARAARLQQQRVTAVQTQNIRQHEQSESPRSHTHAVWCLDPPPGEAEPQAQALPGWLGTKTVTRPHSHGVCMCFRCIITLKVIWLANVRNSCCDRPMCPAIASTVQKQGPSKHGVQIDIEESSYTRKQSLQHCSDLADQQETEPAGRAGTHRVFSSCSCLGKSETVIFACESSLAAATATAAHSRASTSCLAISTDVAVACA
jgi:hypothetical protein